jgi:anaerobic magnesium-protoporphyrin IX monomethyl ester cyclase
VRTLFVDPAPRCGMREPYEHLGLSSLSAVLSEKGYQAEILSAPLLNDSPRRLVKKIIRFDPHILGFSVKEINARRTLRLIKTLRHAGLQSHITLGGHFPTFNPIQILQDFPEVDSIVRGEGEYTMAELVHALDNGGPLSTVRGLTYREGNDIADNPPRPLIEDLDRLPFPSRDMTPQVIHHGGTIGISASRGCYGNCSFCSIRSFYSASPGQKWRSRSPRHVVDEIEMLASRFPQTPFTFIDDQFIGPGEKGKTNVLDTVSEIQKRGLSIQFIVSCRVDAIEEDLFASLKAAGLKRVFLGVESGTQQGLDRLNKKTSVEQNKRALKILDAIGLEYTIAFIFFDPYSTMKTVKGNLEFLSDIRTHWQGKKGVLSIEPSITVHKGTPIERHLRSEGRLSGNYLGYRYTIEDRKVQIVRTIVDCLIRRILPTFHQLRIKGRSITKRMKKRLASVPLRMRMTPRRKRCIANLKKPSGPP